MPATMPTLFVSHGAPTLVADPVPTRDFLMALGRGLPRPKAIVCVSAHWDTPSPRVTGGANPHTMYDFYGFPPELYEMEYKAPGDVALAKAAAKLLAESGLPAQLDEGRGFDHGAWVPLALMYPEADIPVLQVSISSHDSPAHHVALGRALAPLRDEGVLVMASGNATHNLRGVSSRRIDEAPVPYAKAFADWLTGRILANGGAGDEAALTGYLSQGPEARRNHPTADHYVPLLAAFGAGGGDAGKILHDGYTYGVLSMAAYAWGL